MKKFLPEIPNVTGLSPAEAAAIFEERVQILCRAGVVSPNGTREEDRRNTAAGIVRNCFPTLVARMTAAS